jgi:hypothetical protein
MLIAQVLFIPHSLRHLGVLSVSAVNNPGKEHPLWKVATMRFTTLRRWQYAVIGVILGSTAGAIRVYFQDLDLDNTTGGIGRQDLFERSILQPIVYDGISYPQWKDLYIVRVRDPSKESGLCYLVVGRYHESGQYRILSHTPDGKPDVKWSEHFFKAPEPYHPITPLPANAGQPTLPSLGPIARIAELLYLKEPEEPASVIAFLEQARAAHPGSFTYTYQWWRRPRLTIAAWTLGSLAVVGGIWPFIASLLAYGKLFPPPREKPVEPSQPAAKPSPPAPPAAVSQAALEHLRELEAELEAGLSGAGVSSAQADGTGIASPPTSSAASPRVLTGQRLEVAAGPPKDDAVFEAKKDDFYPTERHRPKPKVGEF